jgi:hypothetical protein
MTLPGFFASLFSQDRVAVGAWGADALAAFLEAHDDWLADQELGDEDICDEMRHPLQNRVTCDASDLARLEQTLAMALPDQLKQLLLAVGGFSLYDHDFYAPQRYPEALEQFRSWLKAESLTVTGSDRMIEASRLAPIAGYASDKWLIEAETADIYFWEHGQWALLTRVGSLPEWFKQFLDDMLELAETYW